MKFYFTEDFANYILGREQGPEEESDKAQSSGSVKVDIIREDNSEQNTMNNKNGKNDKNGSMEQDNNEGNNEENNAIQNKTEYVILIVDACLFGGGCTGDRYFPFDVYRVKKKDVHEYNNLVKIEDPSIPPEFEIYMEPTLVGGLNDEIILDFTYMGKLPHPFIPPIPKPMEEYKFYKSPNVTRK